MIMTDVAAMLRELAKDVREELGGKSVMFSVHQNGQVSICSLEAEKKSARYMDTPNGLVMVHAYTWADTTPPLDNPPF